MSYLDAMGIDSYVSRSNLAAALPTRRLRLRRTGTPEPAGDKEASLASVRAGLGLQDVESKAPPPAGVAAGKPAADVSRVPVFSLAAALVGGWLWLEEIPRGREPTREYLQLLAAICQALDWSGDEPSIDMLNWPLNNSAQLDHGIEAARHGVQGFVQARMDRQQPSGVVLLGELDPAWFDVGLVAGAQVLELPAAWEMLRQPLLKKQAWNKLRHLAGGGR